MTEATATVSSPRGKLRVALIRATAATLRERIVERFPGSGLGELAGELVGLSAEVEAGIAHVRRPHWWIRALVALAVVLLIGTTIWAAVAFVRLTGLEVTNAADLVQGVDAAVNELILLGLALLFLISVETRLKRRSALRMLHRLRSLAHVVDMHQLTKDPEQALGLAPPSPTASSPPRTLTRFDLTRYLDYCAEMLSLIAKLAALHTQHLQDPVVLDAVNDVETLTTGLSEKIWQKIMILDISAAGPRGGTPEPSRFAADGKGA